MLNGGVDIYKNITHNLVAAVTYNTDFEIHEGMFFPRRDYSFLNYRAEIYTASYRRAQVDMSYRFGQFYNGNYNDLEGGVTLKLYGYANLQPGANIIRGDLTQGKFPENVYLAKVNLFIPPDLGISNYIQYDDISDLMDYNGRFFWQISPGNIIYLVYNNKTERRWDPEARFHLVEEQFRLKIQLSIRF